jgi:hypothetical protein
MWLTVKGILGGFFILVGVTLFAVGAYWFNRIKYCTIESIQNKYNDDFREDDS